MPLRNYFEYFTEIEDRFLARRGSPLQLSPLDWALIETWKDAGVPLEAVLRGIDDAFNKYEAKKVKGRARRINGLAWCAQSVMEATEAMREASVGTITAAPREQDAATFEGSRIAAHLESCRDQLATASGLPANAATLAQETSDRLDRLAASARAQTPNAEALEQTLRALEEKLLAMLLATLPEDELFALRAEAAREIAPHRSRMQALHIRQIEQQFLDKRLLEKYAVPRLSLFYMRSDG